jgi:2-polyprenyl-6-hydroxyphenyl methylase/3-demethylubiquinone-9 3-methyltransferase
MAAPHAKTPADPAAGRAYFYERFAGDFDREMNPYEVEKRIRLIFGEVFAGVDLVGRRLLDAGCGTGLFSKIAVEAGARVTSVDVGPALLAEVAKKCESERVVGSVTDLPFLDRTFEIVICTEVIEHTPDPRRAVAELARVLAPGGTLVLTTPNRVWHPMIRLANFLKLRPYEGLENWVRWSDLRRWLGEDGLAVAELRGFNALPFLHPVLYPLIDRLDAFGGGILGRLMINILAVASRPAAARPEDGGGDPEVRQL